MSTINWLPTTAIWESNAIGTIVIGMPGSGKTFFLLNTILNCLGMGQRIVAIDPKNDLGKVQNIYPEVPYIDINDIKNTHPGALNPMTFLTDCDAVTLLTLIEILCGKIENINKLAPIIQDFITAYKRDGVYKDMTDVANYLFAYDDVQIQNIGSQLKLFADSKYGPLLFTNEQNVEPLKIPKDKSVIISIFGMQLPDYTKEAEEYSAEERLASGIVFLLTTKLIEVLSTANKIPTTFVCDEAHILFGNKELSETIHKFLSLGRSLNVAVVLASQGIQHFPDKISQFMSTKFAFKSSMEEAESFLDIYDVSKLDPSKAIDIKSTVNSISNLETGQCFIIDSKNRVGFVKITSNYDTKLLSSNPLDRD